MLGAILIDNSILGPVLDILESRGESRLVGEGRYQHRVGGDYGFLSDYNRRIFFAILRLAEKKEPIELVTLTDALHSAGELEEAGGAAYIAQLLDGVPHVTNAAYYAKIVYEKAVLRDLIHAAHAAQQLALDGTVPPEVILSRARCDIFPLDMEPPKTGLVCVDFCDFLSMELEPRRYILNPILPTKGIGMLHAWRGVGKTFVMLEMAYCIAAGVKKCFAWEIPEPRPVVYIDGEMDSTELQERARELAKGHGSDGLPSEKQFRLVSPDFQKNSFPDISSAAGQKNIEGLLRGGELLALDNTSCLCPSGEEKEVENWVSVQEWLLSLRRRGISVLFLHHQGKGGTQRGWSGREDILNLTLALRTPANYERDQGLRCEVHIEKLRGKGSGAAVQPFELQAESVNGATVWTMRPLREVIEKQAFEMFERGEKNRDIETVLRLNRFQIYRLRKKFEQRASPEE